MWFWFKCKVVFKILSVVYCGLWAHLQHWVPFYCMFCGWNMDHLEMHIEDIDNVLHKDNYIFIMQTPVMDYCFCKKTLYSKGAEIFHPAIKKNLNPVMVAILLHFTSENEPTTWFSFFLFFHRWMENFSPSGI